VLINPEDAIRRVPAVAIRQVAEGRERTLRQSRSGFTAIGGPNDENFANKFAKVV
jgi:hypothetical protein